ncbi:Ig-like domain-containing protein [Paenibacillus sp. UMB7766-LJ446]|uniref:Ig-like domain-containing protein n=1 Tax=Paenibacillus sp. UMB7766-LJ446 TaxID=3046313 RepID=UPI002550D61D|nr:Ig-like domain-containing protein [Paenibacillus sp. UMB7766-LJ446]MDK8193127.1 Ig-like domain-containing protein [Paenibacillus sp. UMB7766-LJ446]
MQNSKKRKWKYWVGSCVLGLGVLCLASSVQAAGKMTYVYDANNRMTSATTSEGIKYNYEYDKNGNLLRITQNMPQAIGKLESVTYISSGKVSIKGWALDKSGVKSIQIYLGRIPMGDATYGKQRDDILKAYPAYSNSNAGYEYTFTNFPTTPGTYTIKVVQIGNDGTQKEYLKDIVIPEVSTNPQPPDM